MHYSKGTKIVTILIIIMFLFATFGVVILYLTDPSEETVGTVDGVIDAGDIEITQPEIDIATPTTDPLLNEEATDIDLAPSAGEPIPVIDPIGNDPLE